MTKRTFLKNTSLLGLGSLVGFSAMGKMADAVANLPAAEVARNEDFWEGIRASYNLTPDYINLENGYYNIMPREIMDAYFEHLKQVNIQGARYMRTVQDENKNAAVIKLAAVAGCAPDQLVITRNTTESLDLVISGMDWKRGDEAVMAQQDYGSMLDMFDQVSRRYGMTNKIVSLPTDPASDEEIVSLYEAAITPNTRLLMICHMVNITGHILPVRKICDMAHKRNVPVMVDGAHALAHIQFKIDDLNCDYYGCSLHKWLCAPLGTGMLYVKKEHIGRIWPLFADKGKQDTDILRLNHTGTHPVAADLTISDAIDFYNHIGPARKEERLRYLQQYWTAKARQMPHVQLYTPSQPQRACGIANAGIKGMEATDMAKTLLDKYRIYTVAINNAGVHGCRITPNVFTTTGELDVLVKALGEMG